MPPLVINDRVKRFLPAVAVLIAMFASYMAAQQYINERVAAVRRAYEKKLEQVKADYPEPVQVIVAARDLPVNTVLEAADLKPGQTPEKFLQPYSVQEPGKLLGLVTVAPIAAGEQVLLNKVRRPQDIPLAATLSSVVPKGKRAVTISVDTITGVGGFVRPGDIVDVLWTIVLPGEDPKAGGQPITMTLFQDVSVMAVEKQLRERRAVVAKKEGKEGEEASEDTGETPVEKNRDYTVTLALDPQEVSFLLFAREQGRIQLSLRPKNERGSQTALTPANMNTLLTSLLGPQVMQQAPAKTNRQVELFKGLERDVVVLSEAAQRTEQRASPPPTLIPSGSSELAPMENKDKSAQGTENPSTSQE